MWFSADARLDWRAANRYRDDALRAANGMATAVVMGFLLPLATMLILEIRAVSGRRTRSRDPR